MSPQVNDCLSALEHREILPVRGLH